MSVLPQLRGLAVSGLVVAAGCAPQETGDPDAAGEPGAPALAAHAPEHFGFGTPASARRIELWDIDVKPDGEGLPPGSGSVAEGRRVYEISCLQCHGPTGTEGPNDRLAGDAPWNEWPPGRSVGVYWPYATTLFDYTRRAMPQTTPGTLADDEVYAVVAYILYLNGLVAEDAVMDAASLSAIEMPARDRFVPDDRTGGAVVR